MSNTSETRRSAEKGFLKQHGFPHAPYADIFAEDDIGRVDAGLFPGILKAARFGYDGKGQVRVRERDEALPAYRQFKGEPCILERMLPLDYEVSVVHDLEQVRETAMAARAAIGIREGAAS